MQVQGNGRFFAFHPSDEDLSLGTPMGWAGMDRAVGVDCNCNGRFPSGMTERKARATARQQQIPRGNDRKKSKGKCKATADSLQELQKEKQGQMQGSSRSFAFHPSDEDLSLGTPVAQDDNSKVTMR